MDATRLASIIQSAAEFPKPKALLPSYGTAGFRSDAALLTSTVFRCASRTPSPQDRHCLPPGSGGYATYQIAASAIGTGVPC